jgi:hypothetical protein
VTKVLTLNNLISMPLALALILALLTGPVWYPLALDGAWDWYDRANPVVSGKATLISLQGGRATFRGDIQKHRDCDRTGIWAYSSHSDGVQRKVAIHRVDGNEPLGYLPAGTRIVGEWQADDVDGAYAISVRMAHDCAGRTVTTHLFDVRLK